MCVYFICIQSVYLASGGGYQLPGKQPVLSVILRFVKPTVTYILYVCTKVQKTENHITGYQ